MTPIQTENLALTARLRALAEEAVADSALYVVDVVVKGAPGSRTIEVYLDGAEGAGLDDMARVSRRLGFLLDTEDLVEGRYRLNVSSPGPERALVMPRQYPKYVGRELEVTYAAAAEVVSVRGTLREAGDDAVTLDVPGPDAAAETEGSLRKIPYDAIRDARVLLPW